VATTTFYKSTDDYRFPFAVETIKNAVADGHTVIIVDGSPLVGIKEYFANLGAIVHDETAKGIGPSRRELYEHIRLYRVQHATTPEIIVWLEPEKDDLIRFIPQIVEPIQQGTARIVVPRRTAAAWESYPKFQRASERTANLCYEFATGLDIDIFFGPVAFHAEMLPYFLNCKPSEFGAVDNYIQHYAPVFARRDFHKITSVEVDFRYPPKQREVEEGFDLKAMVERRNEQLETLVDGYIKVVRSLCQL
jgi:hypothetical protein